MSHPKDQNQKGLGHNVPITHAPLWLIPQRGIIVIHFNLRDWRFLSGSKSVSIFSCWQTVCKLFSFLYLFWHKSTSNYCVPSADELTHLVSCYFTTQRKIFLLSCRNWEPNFMLIHAFLQWESSKGPWFLQIYQCMGIVGRTSIDTLAPVLQCPQNPYQVPLLTTCIDSKSLPIIQSWVWRI